MFAGSTKTGDRIAARPGDASVRLFVVWTLFAVFCQCAGWGLSALHALNQAGYSIVFSLFFAGVGLWFWKKGIPSGIPKIARLKKRFRRAFPAGFLILAGLAILGGIIYAPSNYDAHAYRTPRVLHWLAEGGWHWIHSHFGNLNSRGAGFEWVTAPLFLFTRTDRFEFLINAICLLFMPGRAFAILTRLGIRPRVAYYWMWIFPTGYGFLLQAGSVGNDLFSALWPMAAFEFALRARETKRVEFVWLSMFAAALMTSSKAFNLLLLPAWGIALLPSVRLLFQRPVASLGLAAVAALASMIPTAILNIRYCGDWTGIAAEPVRLDTGPPFFHIAVNLVLVALFNFAPPIFPFTGAWDRLVDKVIPSGLAGRLNQFFEPDAARLRFGEMQVEEAAGLGFGVSILLLTIVLHQLRRGGPFSIKGLFAYRNLIALAALGGMFVLMAKSGLYAPARYLLPQYFPVLIPIFALPAAGELICKHWWRGLALAMFALAAGLLIISPARPLWPAGAVLGQVNETSSGTLQRAARVYSVYRERPDLLRSIRHALPANAQIVGLISFNNPETSLWRPFGSRRILHIRREDTRDFTRNRGIEYVVMDPNAVFGQFKMPVEEWLKSNDGEVIGRFPVQLLARAKPFEWLLIRLKP